jgi:hypothetical protein
LDSKVPTELFNDAPFRRLMSERVAVKNAREVVAAHCAVAQVERNASEARSAARVARCMQGAELCWTGELERSGVEKRSRRRLKRNLRLPSCPMNLEDLSDDSDTRS